MNTIQFGEMLKYTRKEAKMSQSQLSKTAKITQTYLSQIEGGVKKPNLKTVESIANALGKEVVVYFVDKAVS